MTRAARGEKLRVGRIGECSVRGHQEKAAALLWVRRGGGNEHVTNCLRCRGFPAGQPSVIPKRSEA